LLLFLIVQSVYDSVFIIEEELKDMFCVFLLATAYGLYVTSC